MEHIQLGDGINLYLYETSQFKTITTKVFVQEELSKDKVSATALIPMILRRGTKEHSDYLGARPKNGRTLWLGY